MRTMSNKQCRGTNEDITDFMICTKEPEKGFCKGDSGGPQAVEGKDGKFTLIGIALQHAEGECALCSVHSKVGLVSSQELVPSLIGF